MTLGKVLATLGMEKGFHVTWMPSYGAEVRGGTAHATVRIDSDSIGSPIVQKADTAIIMNSPSLDKFENKINPGGLFILNSSIVKRQPDRDDVNVVEAPLTDEALKLGNVKVANMIAVGIYAVKKDIFTREDLVAVVEKMAARRTELIPVNIKAVERGMELAKQ